MLIWLMVIQIWTTPDLDPWISNMSVLLFFFSSLEVSLHHSTTNQMLQCSALTIKILHAFNWSPLGWFITCTSFLFKCTAAGSTHLLDSINPQRGTVLILWCLLPAAFHIRCRLNGSQLALHLVPRHKMTSANHELSSWGTCVVCRVITRQARHSKH